MNLRLEIIFLVVSYERKNIIFFFKDNTFNNGFCTGNFPYYRLLPIFEK